MSDGDQVQLEELPGVGRLGRNVNHDPRSRAFAAPMATEVRSVKHRRYSPILHQQSIGACTGFSAAQALNCVPIRTKGVVHGNDDGLALYSRATELDPFDGSWQPNDTGSDGLSVAKAAAERGWITSYRWAFGIDEALRALSLAPVITGTNWFEGMDRPTAAGAVTLTGVVRGGHEFLINGINTVARTVRCVNSWGDQWGLAGCFVLSWDQWDQLLQQQGDVTVLVR